MRSKQLASAMRRKIEGPAAVHHILSSESQELSTHTQRRSSRHIHHESTLSLLRSPSDLKQQQPRKRVNQQAHNLGSGRKIELSQLQKEIWTDGSNSKLRHDHTASRLVVNSHTLRPIVKRGISIAGFTTRAVTERMSVLPLHLPEDPVEPATLDEEALKLEELRFVEKIRSLRARVVEDQGAQVKPPSREEGHLAAISYGTQTWLVVYGGIGCQIFTDLWFCPVNRLHSGWIQKELTFSDFPTVDHIGLFQTIHSKDHTHTRLFQSSFTPAGTSAKPCVYLFGGLLRNPKTSVFDGVNHNLYSLDLETAVCTKMQSTSQLKPTHRRYHAACLQDGNLYIIGGLDSRDEPVQDCWRYRPSNQSWTRYYLVLGSRTSEESPLSIHSHTAVAIPTSSKSNYAGKILLFGGEANGEMHNSLLSCTDPKPHLSGCSLLSVHTGGLKVSVSEVTNSRGMLPCGRKGHCMQYWPKMDALLLVSGKNSDGEFLSDVHLYYLEKDFWLVLAVPAKLTLRHNFGVGRL